MNWLIDCLIVGFDRDLPGFPRYRVLGQDEEGRYNLQVSLSTATICLSIHLQGFSQNLDFFKISTMMLSQKVELKINFILINCFLLVKILSLISYIYTFNTHSTMYIKAPWTVHRRYIKNTWEVHKKHVRST